jgi:hypothetical protein
LAVPVALILIVLAGIVLYREYDSRRDADGLDEYWAQFIDDAAADGGLASVEERAFFCAEARKVSRGEPSVFFDEVGLQRGNAEEFLARLC